MRCVVGGDTGIVGIDSGEVEGLGITRIYIGCGGQLRCDFLVQQVIDLVIGHVAGGGNTIDFCTQIDVEGLSVFF